MENLSEELLYSRKNSSLKLSEETVKEADCYCEGYKKFLNSSKTEREAVDYAIELAEKNGFSLFSKDRTYKPGDRVYCVNRGKNIILTIFGKRSIENGVKFAVAHVDSPRLDLKQVPLYEDSDLAFFKTHYYGGIKKYQWVTMPLSLHGVVLKKNGEKVKINLGEKEGDSVFCVSDLLPHLAEEQMKLPGSKLIKGESLNLIAGSRAINCDEKTDLVRLNVAKILKEKYGIVERDLISAELEAVPAFKACDVGLDRSLIGAYGQDDRVCAYNGLMAILNCKNPEYCVSVALMDKEEIGSCGNTGSESNFFCYFIKDLAEIFGADYRTIFSNSECISADVGAAFDPAYADVFEKNNTALCGFGTIVTKYTGSRGKSGASDASAEFVNRITRLFDENNIAWQAGELGKVDLGGGGTVAMFFAKLNVDVIDVGVPLLSMHSPFEISSKLDVFENYRAIFAFLN